MVLFKNISKKEEDHYKEKQPKILRKMCSEKGPEIRG